MKYGGMNFFPNIQRINTLAKGKKEKKKLFSFVWRKQMIFPVAEWWSKHVGKHSWAPSLSAIDPGAWVFIWLKTFVRHRGSQAAGPPLHGRGAAAGGAGIISRTRFVIWSRDRFVQWISARLRRKFPARWMYAVRSCSFALRREQMSLSSPEEFSVWFAIRCEECAN